MSFSINFILVIKVNINIGMTEMTENDGDFKGAAADGTASFIRFWPKEPVCRPTFTREKFS